MVTVILSHEVANYENWRAVFDAGEPLRQQAGVKTLGVYRAADNANHITFMGEAPSVEVVQGLMTNPDLKADMEKAGVIGMPDVKILNKT